MWKWVSPKKTWSDETEEEDAKKAAAEVDRIAKAFKSGLKIGDKTYEAGKEEDNLRVTRQGRVLLGLDAGSAHEKTIFRLLIESNRELKMVAPGLLDETPPESGDIIRRIEVLAELSTATAKRRAQTLLAWRHHIVG